MDDLAAWMDAYGRAWEERDPDQAAALFTNDATYAETPFDEPAVGHDGIRAYWRDAVGPQRDITFGYEIVSAEPAVVRWWASFRRADSANELDGVFILDFDEPTGRCSRLREWWFHRSR